MIFMKRLTTLIGTVSHRKGNFWLDNFWIGHFRYVKIQIDNEALGHKQNT